MGERREPRMQAKLHVRIAGIDASGSPILLLVPTLVIGFPQSCIACVGVHGASLSAGARRVLAGAWTKEGPSRPEPSRRSPVTKNSQDLTEDQAARECVVTPQHVDALLDAIGKVLGFGSSGRSPSRE